MEIKRNDKYSSEIKQLMIKKYLESGNRDTSKLHISDILNPRLSYFRHKYGNNVTEDDVCLFMPGQAFHLLLQQIMGNEHAEKRLEFDEVIGTADFSGAILAEIKTSRKYTIPDVPEKHYCEQLRKYMAIENKLDAKVIVIYFVAGRKWDGSKPSTLEIVAWDITCTQEELEEEKKIISDRKLAILESNKDDKFERLPLCWEFMCYSEYQKKITKVCSFYNICQPSEKRYNEKAEKLCDELNKIKEKTNVTGN